MIFSAFQSPQMRAWQMKLSRIPRWGWIAIAIGVILPFAVLFLVALLIGLAVLAAVFLVLWVRGMVRRIGGKLHDDGRRNVRIMVRQPNKL